MTALPYTIRRSNRALHARIQVDADGVEVVLPRHFPLRNVEPFVEEKRPWIERTLRRIRESEELFPPADVRHGVDVPYLGERLALRVGVEPSRGGLGVGTLLVTIVGLVAIAVLVTAMELRPRPALAT